MKVKQERAVLLMMRGSIAELPAEQQSRIHECHQKLRAIMAEYGDEGFVAIALLGATLAAEAAEES